MATQPASSLVTRRPTLQALVEWHAGNNVDKWEANLQRYERELAELRDRPISVLEIGVNNGGSLDVWADYFEQAERIVGIDINWRCRLIEFRDPRIQLVIGDIGAAETQAAIDAIHAEYDLIVDDGSHRSHHIVEAFLRLVPRLRPGGLYVIEDLCCSYWQEYGGGVRRPDSAMNFLKRLSDVLNEEHWRSPLTATAYLSEVANPTLVAAAQERLRQIESLTFSNSMCVVRMLPKAVPTELGRRISRGTVAQVSRSALKEESVWVSQIGSAQQDNPDSQITEPRRPPD